MELNGFHVEMRRDSLFESVKEKYKTLGKLQSYDRRRSQSRSSDHTRDRFCSQA